MKTSHVGIRVYMAPSDQTIRRRRQNVGETDFGSDCREFSIGGGPRLDGEPASVLQWRRLVLGSPLWVMWAKRTQASRKMVRLDSVLGWVSYSLTLGMFCNLSFSLRNRHNSALTDLTYVKASSSGGWMFLPFFPFWISSLYHYTVFNFQFRSRLILFSNILSWVISNTQKS